MSKLPAYLLAILVTVTAGMGPAYGADRSHVLAENSRLIVNSTGAMITAEKRKLQFFNNNGNLNSSRRLRSNELVFLPQNGRVAGILRFNDNSPTSLQPVAFELYDMGGKRLYSISKPKFSSAIVSPDGATVVGIDGAVGLPESVLRFIDRNGKEITAVSVEYFQSGRFSDDGSVLFFTTTKDGILAYSSTAQALGRFGQGSVYDCSADGRIFAIRHQSTVRLYSEGKRLQSVPTGDQMGILAVSPDGRFFGWTEPSRVVIQAVGSDTALFEMKITAPGDNCRSFAFSENGEYFAVGIFGGNGQNAASEQQFAEGRVEVYTLDGRQIKQMAISDKKLNSAMPIVRFVRDSAVLAAITLDEVLFVDLTTP